MPFTQHNGYVCILRAFAVCSVQHAAGQTHRQQHSQQAQSQNCTAGNPEPELLPVGNIPLMQRCFEAPQKESSQA